MNRTNFRQSDMGIPVLIRLTFILFWSQSPSSTNSTKSNTGYYLRYTRSIPAGGVSPISAIHSWFSWISLQLHHIQICWICQLLLQRGQYIKTFTYIKILTNVQKVAMFTIHKRERENTQILIEGPNAAHSQYLFGEKHSAVMISLWSKVCRCLPSFRSHSMALQSWSTNPSN